jgi:hypothetical protein
MENSKTTRRVEMETALEFRVNNEIAASGRPLRELLLALEVVNCVYLPFCVDSIRFLFVDLARDSAQGQNMLRAAFIFASDQCFNNSHPDFDTFALWLWHLIERRRRIGYRTDWNC